VKGADTSRIEDTYAFTGGDAEDLLLRKGYALPLERLRAMRREIDAVYSHLPSSDLVVITLGMTEAWRDESLDLYLNRMPSQTMISEHPGRYSFVRLDYDKSYEILSSAFKELVDAGIKRVVLTVSPVPLQSTFSGMDCLIANSHSKATLRACAEKLVSRFRGIVDYFPSYEMVLFGGLASFQADNIHVKGEIVRRVTKYMVQNYVVDD
jgi:hypothetical protein